jgi:hypothetical protein
VDLPLADISFPSDVAHSSELFHGINRWSLDSHLAFNVILDIYRVFVIVDQTQVQEVSRGQLADYIGMVALAQLKSNPRLADAPSILRLFDGDPHTAPDGVSEWDQAFLKALYVTEQKSKLQETLVVREMVREIAH